MADMGRWIHALVSPNTAYGAAAKPVAVTPVVVPQTRVGNTYQGTALPPGISSLLASSQDSRGKRPVKPDANPSGLSNKQVRKITTAFKRGDQAQRFMHDLFGEGMAIRAEHPDWGIRLPPDRWVDRMFDRVGFFNPGMGSGRDRLQLVLPEWYRRIGLPGQHERSPFYRPPGQ